MQTVLVIDDEAEVSKLVALGLRRYSDLRVINAVDAMAGVRQAREESVAAIVLDLMLPGMPGFDVCKVLHSDPATKKIPIIILSARTEEVDRILCFELGAVDYLTKPFSPRELALRVNNLFRTSRSVEKETLASDTIVIDRNRHYVSVAGKEVSLTAVEFKLLTHLMETRGRVQPRERLLQQVWNYERDLVTRTVDTHMLRLRKKLGAAGDEIETVHGYGYRFRTGAAIAPP